MADLFTPLTEQQMNFLQGLRDGSPEASQLIVHNSLLPDIQNDFTRFDRFLQANGHSSPHGRDLYLTVKRKTVIQTIESVDWLRCLILQCCFSFDEPVASGGQVQLINKGNMFQRNRTDSDEVVFNTVFTEIENGKPVQKLSRNLDFASKLDIDTAHAFVDNFLANYPDRSIENEPFSLGFLLPAKALLKIFKGEVTEVRNTDVTALGQTENLTFQWGLTPNHQNNPNHTDGTLGNFTLIIGIGDATTGAITTGTGPIIEFKWTSINNIMNDCPPNTGCQLSPRGN